MTAFTSTQSAFNSNNENGNDSNNNTSGVTFPQPRVHDDCDDDSLSDTETLSDADFPLGGNLQIQFPDPTTFPTATFIHSRRGLASSSTLTLTQGNNVIRNSFRFDNTSSPAPAAESVFGDSSESLNRLLDSLRLTPAEDTVRNAIECLRDLWRIAKNPFEPRSQFELAAYDAQVLIQNVIRGFVDGTQSESTATKESVKALQHFVSRINQIISEYKEGTRNDAKPNDDDFHSIMACICAQNLTDAISAFKKAQENSSRGEGTSEAVLRAQRSRLEEENITLERKAKQLREELELLKALEQEKKRKEEEEKRQKKQKRKEENATKKEILRILEEEMGEMRAFEEELQRDAEEEAERQRIRKEEKKRARAARRQEQDVEEQRRAAESATPKESGRKSPKATPNSANQQDNQNQSNTRTTTTHRPDFVFVSHQTTNNINYAPPPPTNLSAMTMMGGGGLSMTHDGISMPGLVMNRNGIFMSGAPGGVHHMHHQQHHFGAPPAPQWGPYTYTTGHYGMFMRG